MWLDCLEKKVRCMHQTCQFGIKAKNMQLANLHREKMKKRKIQFQYPVSNKNWKNNCILNWVHGVLDLFFRLWSCEITSPKPSPPVLDRRPKVYGRSRRFKTYGYDGRSFRKFLRPKVLFVVFLGFFPKWRLTCSFLVFFITQMPSVLRLDWIRLD